MVGNLKLMFKDRLFLAGFLVRILLLPVLGSTHFRELFVPFLDAFTRNPLQNPWTSFSPEHFPYGSVLLLIVSLPKILFGWLGPFEGATVINVILYKLPLLFLDVLCLWTLNALSEFKVVRRLNLLYWLNPVLIYISFIHGQLDLACVTFLLLSLYACVKRKWEVSAVLFAASVLCKFHVILILPFILAFIWNKLFYPASLKKVAVYLSISGSLIFLGFLPHLFSGHLNYVTAQSPQAMQLFAGHISYGQNHVLYLGELLIVLGLIRVMFATSISNQGLVFGSAFLLNILLVATSPSPGWLYWVIPFFALSFALNRAVSEALLHALSLTYFLHFGLPELGIAGLNSSVSFTLLQTILIIFIVMIYWLYLRTELPVKRRTTPLLIGISGDSGTGKNYLSAIQAKLFPGRSRMIAGDDYHLWERGDQNWKALTHLHPAANDLGQMTLDANSLIAGSTIFGKAYDHQTGKFVPEREVFPAQILFFQGLHTLYLRSLREQMDLRIFCSPDPLVHLHWKLSRDANERNHSPQEILRSIKDRTLDSETHIKTQKKHADWIIEAAFAEIVSEESIMKNAMVPEIQISHLLVNDSPVPKLALELKKAGYNCTLEHVDSEHVRFTFKGKLPAETVGTLARDIFPELRSILRTRREPQWESDQNGVIQLITISLLCGK